MVIWLDVNCFDYYIAVLPSEGCFGRDFIDITTVPDFEVPPALGNIDINAMVMKEIRNPSLKRKPCSKR
ncbi:hypothetical protein [uncultured Roseobacter sp.]|uniref:hypothetical protein n=1 Tax=uncultured Roseobacter sp. TaxID=114847 RepID=UPI0026018B92|nr:hypothetical protein [uncultured Roseobacter sp.]